jgi:hypothetical protein
MWRAFALPSSFLEVSRCKSREEPASCVLFLQHGNKLCSDKDWICDILQLCLYPAKQTPLKFLENEHF